LRIYEGMFLLDDARCSENFQGVTREVLNILQKNRAEVFSAEKWDERRLCYPIEGRSRAVYYLVRFTAPPEAIRNIERECQLNDTILRALVLRDTHFEKLHKAGLLALRPGEPGETIQAYTKRTAALSAALAEGREPRPDRDRDRDRGPATARDEVPRPESRTDA